MSLKLIRWCSFGILILLLTGCSGQAYKYAYTASGDNTHENELYQDAQFSTTDNIQVVIKLNRHKETLQVSVGFVDPNGDLVDKINAEASPGVEVVILSLEYQEKSWLKGNYRANITINGSPVETLSFKIS